MSRLDKCKHCIARGDIEWCMSTDCPEHYSWYAMVQAARIKILEGMLGAKPYEMYLDRLQEQYVLYSNRLQELSGIDESTVEQILEYDSLINIVKTYEFKQWI